MVLEGWELSGSLSISFRLAFHWRVWGVGSCVNRDNRRWYRSCAHWEVELRGHSTKGIEGQRRALSEAEHLKDVGPVTMGKREQDDAHGMFSTWSHREGHNWILMLLDGLGWPFHQVPDLSPALPGYMCIPSESLN